MSLVGLVGVETETVDILRLTGVGRADGRPVLACNGLRMPVEGVRGAAEGF